MTSEVAARTMRAVRVHAPGDARLDQVPEPCLTEASDVKVRIDAAGICGTDLWLHAAAPYATVEPRVLGHEMAGTVVDAGRAATGLSVGDLVAVRPLIACGTCATCRRGDVNVCERRTFLGIHGPGGAFSEYVVVDAGQVHRLPAPFTAVTGALVETLATCWRAAETVPLDPDDPVLVVGAGPVGLGVVLSLRALGVREVLVSAHGSVRREAAERLGARVVDPTQVDLVRWVDEQTGGAGVAVSYDAAGGSGGVVDQQLRTIRPGGHLVLVAEVHGPEAVDLMTLVRTGKHVHGSAAYTPADLDAVIAAVVAGDLDPAPLVSSTIPLADTVTAGLEHLRDGGRRTELKVVVLPHG